MCACEKDEGEGGGRRGGRRGEEGRIDVCGVQSVRRMRGGRDKCVWWRECT